MSNPEDAAREFLKGLKTRKRQPWDDVASEPAPPARKPAAKPTPKPAAPRTTADDAMSQAERLARRNREIAKKTRYLRKD